MPAQAYQQQLHLVQVYRRLQLQVYQHQSALVFQAVCLHQPQPLKVSVLQQQRFIRHIQVPALVPQLPLL